MAAESVRSSIPTARHRRVKLEHVVRIELKQIVLIFKLVFPIYRCHCVSICPLVSLRIVLILLRVVVSKFAVLGLRRVFLRKLFGEKS